MRGGVGEVFINEVAAADRGQVTVGAGLKGRLLQPGIEVLRHIPQVMVRIDFWERPQSGGICTIHGNSPSDGQVVFHKDNGSSGRAFGLDRVRRSR